MSIIGGQICPSRESIIKTITRRRKEWKFGKAGSNKTIDNDFQQKVTIFMYSTHTHTHTILIEVPAYTYKQMNKGG